MSKAFNHAVCETLIPELTRHLPQFQTETGRSRYMWPGERAFRWIPEPSIHCWLVFYPNPKGHNEFAIEVGWSTRARYPELSMRPSGDGPTPEHLEFSHPEYLTRLQGAHSWRGGWWTLTPAALHLPDTLHGWVEAQGRALTQEEARRLVKPLVDDAVEQVLTAGIPYLETFVAHWRAAHPRGNGWPDSLH